MINFEVVIGIENHVELKTNTKMFSPGKVSYAQVPNSQVNPVDMGYPGTMPTVNKLGVELALRACAGLNLTIDPLLRFDRKNYYYADLPKGFQITQQFFPIGSNGFLIIENEHQQQQKVEIERLHIEEDTAKQIHRGNVTLLDYNRCGIGLIEIVTKPVLRTAFQACQYVEKLREVLLFLKVSDAKMNEGSLRCDVNISLRPFGSSQLGNKVELKNLNSINNVRLAIEYEIKRQNTILLSGGVVEQETRRFDEKTKSTILMRKKSDATDYKYFTEPNILPIRLAPAWIKSVLDNSPATPEYIRSQLLKNEKLKLHDINILMQDVELVEFFLKSIEFPVDPNQVMNYLLGEVLAYLNANNLKISETNLTPSTLSELIQLINDELISSKQAKIVLKELLINDIKPIQVVKKLGLQQITEQSEIIKLVQPIIDTNLELLNQYNDRPERVIKFFMGELMKLTHGQLAPKIGQRIVEELINNYLKNKK